MKITDEQHMKAGVAANWALGCAAKPDFIAAGRSQVAYWAPILRDKMIQYYFDSPLVLTERGIRDFFDSLLAEPDPAAEAVRKIMRGLNSASPEWLDGAEEIVAVVRKIDAAQKDGTR